MGSDGVPMVTTTIHLFFGWHEVGTVLLVDPAIITMKHREMDYGRILFLFSCASASMTQVAGYMSKYDCYS